MNGKTIGERIGEMREAKGLSRRALAMSAGVSDNAIYKIEHQGGAPAFTTGLLIARALEADPWTLAFGTEIPPENATGTMQAVRMAFLEDKVKELEALVSGKQLPPRSQAQSTGAPVPPELPPKAKRPKRNRGQQHGS